MNLLTLERVHAQITTTKLAAFGLGNPSVSVSRNGEWTRPGSLAHVVHGRSYWGSCCWTNQERDDVIGNQWNCRIGHILGVLTGMNFRNGVHTVDLNFSFAVYNDLIMFTSITHIE